jgi:hypothetical protein
MPNSGPALWPILPWPYAQSKIKEPGTPARRPGTRRRAPLRPGGQGGGWPMPTRRPGRGMARAVQT